MKILSENSKSSILKDSGLTININFKISINRCEKGDIFDPVSMICDPCGKGTYTFANPYNSTTICRNCIKNANCLGGSNISPIPGYYRYDTNTDIVIKCSDHPEACLGGGNFG